MRKRICTGAAVLAAVLSMASGAAARIGFGLLLLRSLILTVGFAAFVWLILTVAVRKLPDLFSALDRAVPDSSAEGETVISTTEGENSDENQPAFEPVSPNFANEIESESPTLMREIVEQYTPEQLSKAIRTALNNE